MLAIDGAGEAATCLRVDLPATPDGSSFDLFRQNSAPLMSVSLPDPADASRFTLQAVNFQLPNAVVSRICGSAFDANRSAEDIARDPAPLVQIIVQLSGHSFVAVGTPFRTEPGDVTFFDYARPFASTSSTFEMVCIMAARDRVPPSLLEMAAHGARLPCDSGSARLLAASLVALHDAMSAMSISQGELAVEAICRLAADLLGASRDVAVRQPELTFDAALRFVEERLGDRMLDAGGIAKHFGVSRATLYRLFQPLGGVDAAIRTRRLDRAMRAILAGLSGELETARQAFRNEEHFARAFQTRFGERPATFRAKVQSHDKAWLSAQALRAGFTSHEAWLTALQREP